MLNSLQIVNFKGFNNTTIEFKKLTLLTGCNSTGKSSIIQAILLLHRAMLDEMDKSNKYCAQLLNQEPFGDLLNLNFDSHVFSIDGKIDGDQFYSTWNIDANKISEVTISDSMKNYHNILYLNAQRLVQSNIFPIPTKSQLISNPIGNHGEFAAYHLSVLADKRIFSNITTNEDKLYISPYKPKFKPQIEAWLSQIKPQILLQAEQSANENNVSLQFYLPNFYGEYHARDVGLGVKYALPIFVAGLMAKRPSSWGTVSKITAKRDTIFIVENPEAYLHPQGQVVLGTFLANIAASGIQCIVKTHSDHVLNAIRVAVSNEEISPDDVQINFLTKFIERIDVYTPKIDQDGHIDEWPSGFFDEFENQLSQLF